MKKLTALLIAALNCATIYANIDGFWLIRDSDNKPESVVAFYESNGAHYCKMIAIFDENSGKITDTISKPIEKAAALEGNPYLCGLDIIWGLQKDGSRYVGKVINPDSGHIFKCEVWLDTETPNTIVVRGELLVFGQNQYWQKFEAADLPESVNLKKLKPNVVDKKSSAGSSRGSEVAKGESSAQGTQGAQAASSDLPENQTPKQSPIRFIRIKH